MSSELVAALEALAQEKNIDEMYLLERLEQSLAKSYKAVLKLDWDASVTINRETGNIYVYEMVGIGDMDEETGEFASYEPRDVTPKDVSRIAAQNAKSVIMSIVRDAGRQSIYSEFVERKGELVTGTVLQTTPDFTIIKIRDGVEAELPHFDKKRGGQELNERPENERYRHNKRLKSLIIDVRDPAAVEASGRGENARPSIVVSRTHPDLLRRLFEIEVPEIYDGVVEIKSIAREAGARSKIAVSSREPNLDPVGACVGPKGSRVRMVVEELSNERVDVIQWDADPTRFVSNALSPANVSRVLINDETHYATVIVPDDQLSLAIGKEGQNARLAARLTGWHIDIKSASLVGELPDAVSSLIDEDAEAQTDADAGRCEYITKSGARCRNHARPGSHFCGIHEKSGADASEDLSDNASSKKNVEKGTKAAGKTANKATTKTTTKTTANAAAKSSANGDASVTAATNVAADADAAVVDVATDTEVAVVDVATGTETADADAATGTETNNESSKPARKPRLRNKEDSAKES
jgi:N utilization substance protein A